MFYIGILTLTTILRNYKIGYSFNYYVYYFLYYVNYRLKRGQLSYKYFII